jgi:hypothetical protein
MYTDQQIRVLPNGEYSNCSSVKNSVKQSAVVSPILFCVYLDVLQAEYKKTGLGCFISAWLAAALVYGDDMILMAPSARAMREVTRRFAISSQKNIVLRSNILNPSVLHSITLKQAAMYVRQCRLLQKVVT